VQKFSSDINSREEINAREDNEVKRQRTQEDDDGISFHEPPALAHLSHFTAHTPEQERPGTNDEISFRFINYTRILSTEDPPRTLLLGREMMGRGREGDFQERTRRKPLLFQLQTGRVIALLSPPVQKPPVYSNGDAKNTTFPASETD
jgi:hypothetical protein